MPNPKVRTLTIGGVTYDLQDNISGYITGITSSDVTTALGFTPYNGATNPNGYTSNTGTITSVKTTAGAHTTINVSSGAANFNVPTKTSHLTNDSGFLTSYTETDPTVPSWAKASSKPSYSLTEISGTDDLRAIEGLTGTSGFLKKTAANTWALDTNTYLTSYTETDPVFSASAAAGITSTDISNWNGKSDTDTKNTAGSTNSASTLYLIGATSQGDNPQTYSNSSLFLEGGILFAAGGISLTSSGSNYNGIITATANLTSSRNIEIPDKSGTIALTSDLPSHSTQTATLTTTWTSNQQTVTVSGVTSSNYVIVSPAPASYDDYCEAGIYCSAQGTNSLTFKCDTAPSSSLTVNVMIIG